ncbi:tyrosine-type recombinase/integrase [Amycolatopsis sp. NPDC057786]|uniref:tyrosine-type recombinase/integrase n=1 Tax=Amycolatopsis sp. NPDC057786 TaxID=3346250 RepID=UPI00366FFBEF
MAWTEKIGPRSWRVRYPTADGRIGSRSGFGTKRLADDYANQIEADQRRGIWLDPQAAKTSVSAWVALWTETLDVEVRTEENYRSRIRNQIEPRWGSTAVGDITALAVTLWVKELRRRYARSTVAGVVTVFSMMLDDAVDERLIAVNPVRRRARRGRRRERSPVPAERVWATPEQVVRISDNAELLGGRCYGLLVVTAGWTGARWGELTGLRRVNTHLDDGCIGIDPDTGCLHEGNHRLWLGPPKTPASARTITLPPFLIDLLRDHLDGHDGEFVFASPRRCWLRRSDFDRRVFRPAVDGNLQRPDAAVPIEPVRPGLTFHGLRHSHKTWMIADGIPEIAQARRLGHRLDNRIVETYSHVAPEVERRLLRCLERRWRKARTAVGRPNAPQPAGSTGTLVDPHRAGVVGKQG